MKYDTNNIFAKILRGEIPCQKIYENDHALAFKDINPQVKIHILVIPKGPYVNMDDFSQNAKNEEIIDFIRALGEVSKLAGVSEYAQGKGYRYISNNGPDGGQEVPHLHFHMVGGESLGRMLSKK